MTESEKQAERMFEQTRHEKQMRQRMNDIARNILVFLTLSTIVTLLLKYGM